ncbi:hypothetical protein [Rudanella lutea]|uniref:hypothetical protein n=1 Tax=Rudanella lutea TaxID=451374 RepID=UPI000480329C|nr:hypothetical protein [Rudanella lutea]
MNTRTLHYVSGLFITVFVGFHLINHTYSLAGASAHIGLMNTLRLVYRHPVVETMLLGAIALQVVSGLSLASRFRKRVETGFDKLQLWTGLYLAFFLLIHLSAVLVGRLVLDLDTNFYFGVAGLNTFPLNLFFIPYYGLAIASFVGHLAAIHSRKMKHSVLGLTPHEQASILLALGVLLTISILYGLTNGFHGVRIPDAYKVLTKLPF